MASLVIGARRPKVAGFDGVVTLAIESLVVGVCRCFHLVDYTPYKFLAKIFAPLPGSKVFPGLTFIIYHLSNWKFFVFSHPILLSTSFW